MEDIGSNMQSIMKQLPQKAQTELIPQLKTSNTIDIIIGKSQLRCSFVQAFTMSG